MQNLYVKKEGKKMKVSFECVNCKVSQVESPKAIKVEKGIFNGQSIQVMYYDCPVCGGRNIVQVDNDESLRLLAKCKSIISVQMKANRQGRRGKQSGKMKKAQIHLRKIRNELQKELECNCHLKFVEYKTVGDDYAGL